MKIRYGHGIISGDAELTRFWILLARMARDLFRHTEISNRYMMSQFRHSWLEIHIEIAENTADADVLGGGIPRLHGRAKNPGANLVSEFE